MSSMAPRGPLPARVYWVRRTLVLVVALALVFGIGKLLTGFGGDPKATTAAAVPTGTCDPADIDVVPALRKVDGGSATTLPLKLVSTNGSCTWQASPNALVVKVVSGKDRIWTSQDCRSSVPT